MRLPVVNEELAKRIQQSEIDYFSSRISSIGERSDNPEGVEIKKVGNSIAFYIKSMPWGLFNSVKGFSEDDIDRLEEVINFYRERERRFQLEINPIGVSPKMFRHLSERGLFQEGFHSVLYGLPSKEAPELPPKIKINQINHETDFDHFAGVHCVGSGMDIAHKHHFVNNNVGLLNRPGWKLYLAYWNEKPAAVAVMYCSGSIASFTLAATAPEFRRNGLQTSLLKWRMHEAYRAGCELVVAQASFGSPSQNNMERVGMQIAWTRAVWVPH
ncbi:GNAT family N-acetyltransferase [Paenibacillus oleatilyticus]|uniref:GNAT family N-acetyltransferase n=1 Tax=Paenibacillus oleatilyticus TaxID=2594886 RepID=UPI001C1FFF63|nr:N-acetyltransferase [Paenibacillus oleatilyticus]MBU7320217.1 N-acetyltransferase [Paenibacillus oleatilyticus]